MLLMKIIRGMVAAILALVVGIASIIVFIFMGILNILAVPVIGIVMLGFIIYWEMSNKPAEERQHIKVPFKKPFKK